MHEYFTNHGYRALINASVLSGIGDSLYNIVFIIYASTTPFKSLAVSLASVATLLPNMLSLLTGYFADATSRKTRWMILTRIMQAVLFVILAGTIALPATVPLFLSLLALNIVSDTCGQYSNGLTLPLYKHLLPTGELNAALSFSTAAHTTVQTVFQGVGATIIVLLNHNYVLFGLLNAATFLLSAWSLIRQRQILQTAEPAQSARPSQRLPLRQSIRQTLAFLHHDRSLFILIIFAFLINLLTAANDGMMTVTLLSTPRLWLNNYGYTVAVLNMTLSIGLIAGSLFANDGLQRLSIMKLMALILAAAMSLAVAFLGQWSIGLIIASLFATGYLLGKINPRISTLLMMRVPEKEIAAMSGVVGMVTLIGAPIGQVVFLGIANGVSPAASWLTFGVAAFCLLILTVMMVKKMPVSD
ncbi:MAG: MFS transporter [Schleiferilactobacillus harbinensis]|jgi:MFS family permease|nr:MFS transporter [Schleiferilactobacillus harbinensis]MCI1913728.1 MFS transporter [Schleiferilactobacillus harbinensis]